MLEMNYIWYNSGDCLANNHYMMVVVNDQADMCHCKMVSENEHLGEVTDNNCLRWIFPTNVNANFKYEHIVYHLMAQKGNKRCDQMGNYLSCQGEYVFFFPPGFSIKNHNSSYRRF